MIKKSFVSIGVAVFLLATVKSQSQTVVDTNSWYKQALTTAKDTGLLTATNYAIEPYLTYAPKLANGKSYTGGGVLAMYNLNNYVGAGLGIDYLGQFSLVSGNVSLKYAISAGDYLKEYVPLLPSAVTNITLVPFALGGLGIPCSGGTGSGVSTIEDAGAYIQYGNFLGGKFNTGACYGQWNNAGDYSGKRYHIFAGWSHGF
tara:strand:+ start:1193 stop:1798 length:606 start_codon:yes stop_codon:yes gene_type:complete